MTVEDLLHAFILDLLRRGYTTAQVTQALASQKVQLMQADTYIVAIKDAPHGDVVNADE